MLCKDVRNADCRNSPIKSRVSIDLNCVQNLTTPGMRTDYATRLNALGVVRVIQQVANRRQTGSYTSVFLLSSLRTHFVPITYNIIPV